MKRKLVPYSDLDEGPQPLIEGPQPMEVAPADNAGTVENQVSDEPQASRFTWRIENFSRLNMKKLYSDVFIAGGYKWRVLIFPKGNNVDYMSMYLDVADSATLPYGWNRYAQFSLAIVNPVHSKYTIKKDTQHQFNQRESDWGFTSFMALGELYDPNKGYLVNDTCVVEADVAVRKVIDYWTYDSKKETGYVGLKNQGATCYMNSLLQTLYHIPYFRKAVYRMPTTENDNPTGSIPLALQSLFYKLQHNDTSVATKELTKSFGWDTYDSFMQHDVQELNRVLCEKLEDKMKGTVVEGTIQKLFEGHHMNYSECINVDFKSTRKESFYDLQLDVKGCKDVYASFDKYVEVERLEGDNKYHAKEHGLQDAKKGVLFIDFPPVLQLQLKRFEYDFMRDTMVKINDRYEFPLELDLDRDNGKYLSPEADRSVRNLYTLHSVLVHSGGVHGGHYYAFIRPRLSDQWYKFDDERVTKEDVKRALEEQYGCEEELPQTNPGCDNTPFKFTKYSNAYMLVYIRVSDKDKIVCDVHKRDIAEHLQHESLLVKARLSRAPKAPMSLESNFGTTMARLSVAERAKQRISTKRPKPTKLEPAASKPVEPPSQRTRRPSNSFGEQTVSSPIGEVAADPVPPTQAPTTSSNALSFFNSAARGLALSIGDSLVRDVDREVLKDASTKDLAEASCLASLQVMTIQNVWAKKCQATIENWRAAQRQLEEEKATHAVKVAEMDSQAAKMGSRVAKLEGALAKSRTEVAKARADAVQKFKDSPAYAGALKQAVEAYKKSDECLDWADERSVDYLEVGFARCRLQLQERGLLPPGTDLDFLDYSKEMPGEPSIREVASEWEQ